MRKGIFILFLIISIFAVSCSSEESDFIRSNKNKIKDTIDLVLSYENGYDDTMKKHINEENFYGSNFFELYTMYIGEVEFKDYKSKIISLREEGDKYLASTIIDIKALTPATHTHDDGSVHEQVHEIAAEDIPVEITLVEKEGEFFIEGFLGYENLDKAKELNEGFR
ncbi:hypothetical protein R0131_16075 [Clostridium sp. AL.422]|uniref:hypothetical protein n=1 Tax=Clostridium TaxID=1485 RepID=UPI00293DE6EF|nr:MULTISPECIES: hypothetical protein [unclassified Clostridium]MDV4152344.1 hypothetical protein [Clostridium sp. AL.422]